MTGAGRTDDGFLGGRLHIRQPAKGFRSGVDAVLLAAAVPAVAGQSVLELGCGAAACVLCLGARVPGLALNGLELQGDYAALARENAARNHLDLALWQGDVADVPKGLRDQTFDHVIANPPYYRRAAHSAPDDAGRAAALGESVPLAAWVDAGTRRLKPRGWLTVIQKAGRLRDLIDACDARLGSFEIKPIAPRAGHQAELVILRVRKGGRADLRLFAPLVMHLSTHHVADEDSYTPVARDILRKGGSLKF